MNNQDKIQAYLGRIANGEKPTDQETEDYKQAMANEAGVPKDKLWGKDAPVCTLTEAQQIEKLKIMVLFLANCYQKNFDRFASSQCYSQDIKDAVKPETFENIWRVFSNFSTVQGSSMRELVETLAFMHQKDHGGVKDFRHADLYDIFGITRMTHRKEIYDTKWVNWKEAKIADTKEIWEKPQ